MWSSGLQLFDEVTDIVWIFVGIEVILLAVGFVRQQLNKQVPASGDSAVAGILDDAWNTTVRRRAAALVDLDGERVRVRSAYVACDGSTLFEIGSVSKALTGLLLAEMSAAGEVGLDEPLADVHPGYRARALGKTTLRELARHRSGLPTLPRTPTTFFRFYLMKVFQTNPYAWVSQHSVLRAAGRARLKKVGVESYSNLGASVAGAIAAEMAQEEFAEVLRQRVLEPAGMAQTRLGHRSDGLKRGWTKHGRRSARWRMTGHAPTGGVVSTPDDMASLVTYLLTTPSPAQEALRGDGLFWVVQTEPESGRTVAWHNGQTGGYSAHVAIYPEARCAAFVLADTSDASQLAPLVRRLVRHLIAERSSVQR